MKISYNWIRDYLNIDLDPLKVAEILTDVGLEIEGTEEWESVKGGLNDVVIGEVLTCRKHPAADRLFVTTVSTGKKEPLQVVCGAPNVAAGQKVAVALAGAILYRGDERLEIKRSKIRGELSEGMICAEDEIGMGDSHEGIMVLENDAVPGTPASDYFKTEKDFIFEIGLTPNRIDSGSHFGVARDLAAYLAINEGYELQTRLPSVGSFQPDNTSNKYEVVIENKRDCPRYTGLTISGVNVGESPAWLKNRLRAIGQNPINNVVDITNYVLHEIGQPLHAFNADMIKGRKVIIKNLPDNTSFVTLDGIERRISAKDLMICNESEGMCIAGVFGGIGSGVTEKTKNVFLESAYFNPVSIRKTSKRHGLQTDASFRFERGADPNIALWALKRTAMLIREIAGGEISSEPIDVYPEEIKNVSFAVSYRNIDRLIGKSIDRQVIKKILELLDIVIRNEDDNGLLLEIPAYRVDVHREADVIEEILRIYGYNNIQISNHVNSTLTFTKKPDREKVTNIIADLLTANSFNEIMCNSLNPANWYEKSDDFNNEEIVMLANPLSSDLNAMRQSLLYGGLTSIMRNINRQAPDLKFYEFGNIYFKRKTGPSSDVTDNFIEKTALDLFITGNKGKQNWDYKTNPTDFYYIKSATEMILKRLGIDPENLSQESGGKKYFAESISYLQNNILIAEAGRIARSYLKDFDIDQDVYYAHIEWDFLLKLIKKHTILFKEPPRYPSVRRDLALLLDSEINFGTIRSLAFRTEKILLKEVGLFDVYQSETLGKNKKSYAVSFILRDDTKTLTDKNIDKIMNNLVNVFRKELGAQIR